MKKPSPTWMVVMYLLFFGLPFACTALIHFTEWWVFVPGAAFMIVIWFAVIDNLHKVVYGERKEVSRAANQP